MRRNRVSAKCQIAGMRLDLLTRVDVSVLRERKAEAVSRSVFGFSSKRFYWKTSLVPSSCRSSDESVCRSTGTGKVWCRNESGDEWTRWTTYRREQNEWGNGPHTIDWELTGKISPLKRFATLFTAKALVRTVHRLVLGQRDLVAEGLVAEDTGERSFTRVRSPDVHL